MKRVLLIINPVSGQQKIQPKLFSIVNALCKEGCTVITQTTQYRGHATELAKTAIEKRYDTIICCGGDGTLNETVSGLMASKINHLVRLGYIPCGSTNDFADTLGLDIDPSIQVENIIKQNVKQLDIGHFDKKKFFSYIASFGAFTDASYSAPQELKNRVGHFAYILEGLKDMSNIHPIHAKVIADGKEYEDDYIFGSVSNTKSVAGLVKLKEEMVDLTDGLFEVMLVKYPKNIIKLNEILLKATSSNFNSDMFDFFRAKDIRFEFKECVSWSLDGEKAIAGETVEIEALKKAIELYA